MAFPARYLEFLRSDRREDRVLVRYEPIDRAGDPVNLYRSTDAYSTETGDSISAQLFEADIVKTFGFVSKVDLDNLYGIVSGATGGKIIHRNDCGELDSWRSAYYFDGRKATVYHGGWSEATGELAFEDYGVLFLGVVKGQPLVGLADVEVSLGPTDLRFDFNFSDQVLCGLPWHLNFNGSSDYVDCGNHSEHDFTGAFTVEGRFLAPGSPAADAVIFSRGQSGTDGWRIEYSTARKVRLVTYQSGASQTTESTTALTAQRKYSLGFRLRSDGSAAILIDGVVDDESAVGTHTMPATASRTFFWMKNNSGSVYLDGWLSEVRLWSVARSNAQIAGACHRTLTAAERLLPNLVGYWPCDEGPGTTLNDRSASGHNGTIAGADWYPALEGAPEDAGSPLPQAWGPCEGVEGVLVATNPPIWQLHERRIQGLIEEETAPGSGIFIGGGREGGAPRARGNVYTTWLAFLSSTTAAGKYDLLRTPGGSFVRFNVPPTLAVTWNLEGDDTDGTYRETTPDIVRRFLTNFGPDPLDDSTELDGTAFDAAAAAQPAPQGYWWRDKRTVREAANLFLRSTQHTVFELRSESKFTIYRFEGVEAAVAAAASVPTITQNDVVLDGSLKATAARAPVWRTTIPARRNFRKLEPGELSAAIAGASYSALKRFLLEEWRYGYGANSDVRRKRLQSRELVYEESTFHSVLDAQDEAERQTDLYDGEEQALQLFVLNGEGLNFELFAPFYLHIELEDADHAPLDRLGTGSNAAFVTLATGFDPFAGGSRLTAYREDS